MSGASENHFSKDFRHEQILRWNQDLTSLTFAIIWHNPYSQTVDNRIENLFKKTTYRYDKPYVRIMFKEAELCRLPWCQVTKKKIHCTRFRIRSVCQEIFVYLNHSLYIWIVIGTSITYTLFSFYIFSNFGLAYANMYVEMMNSTIYGMLLCIDIRIHWSIFFGIFMFVRFLLQISFSMLMLSWNVKKSALSTFYLLGWKMM